jgi:hypothetical protein
MSVDATMAVLYAQTGLATSLTNAAAVAPQASVAMSRVLAAEMARQEQQQIAKSEPGSQTTLTPDKEHNSGPQFGNRRRRRPPPQPEPEESSQETSSPLVGNLLNIKV